MKKLLCLVISSVGLSVWALPTYESFNEYSNLVTAGSSVDLATSGFYVTNGFVVEQWGGGDSGFGLLFSQGGGDVLITNTTSSVFTSANLASILPGGFPGAGANIDITAFIPQNQGANTAGNSAVLKFAQDIPRPTSGVTTIYVSYLLDVTGNFNGATGTGNDGRFDGFLSRSNLSEGTGSGGAYITWASMFNTFGTSPNYVAYGYKINKPAITGGDDVLACDSSGADSPDSGNAGVGAIYNTANFVVGCLTFSSNFADTNTVWVNPPIADFGGPTTPASNLNSFKMGTIMSDVNGFFLESRSGSSSGGLGPTFIGNLLIGHTWSYVTGGPEFTNVPQNDYLLTYGTNVTLTGAAVAAAQNVIYQWQRIIGGVTNNLSDGTGTAGGTAVVSGSQSPTLTLTSVSAGDVGQYQLVATASGTGFSLAAPAGIFYENGPVFTSTPSDTAANYGGAASFTASASSTQSSMSYQWYFGATSLTNGVRADGSTVSGAAGTVSTDILSATLVLSNVTYLNGGDYSLMVTDNTALSTQSSFATLTVSDPHITSQPVATPAVIPDGSSGSISVGAVGSGVTYQWYGVQQGLLSDGTGLSGVATPTLLITNAQFKDADSYYAVIGGASGQVITSSIATVYFVNTNGMPFNLMPLGGSIVAGQSAQTPYQGGGFRTGLYLSLAADSRFDPNMVGSSTALLANNPTNVNPLTVLNQLHHEGHPGYTTTMLLANLNTNDSSSGNDGGYWLAPGNGVNPACIINFPTGNDAVKYGSDSVTLVAAVQRFDATISACNALRPEVQNIVSSICYRGDGGGAYSAGLDAYFNPAINALVFNHVLAGQNVGYLDLRNVMSYPSDFGSDDIHPTQPGYYKMANAWYQAIIYGAAYWNGSQNGIWNTVKGASSNWSIDSGLKEGRTIALNDPAVVTNDIYPDVFFNSNTGPLLTTLGADTTIRSLNFTKGATGPVTIGGTNTLTIGTIDSSVTLSTPYSLANCGGITVQAGSGAHTLSANVVLGGSQIWGNVSSNAFDVSGIISGTNALTIAGAYTFYNPGVFTPDPGNTFDETYTTVITNYVGTSAIVLSGQNAYSGGTIVSSGTLMVNGQEMPFSGTGSGQVTVSPGGTLSGNGRIAGPVFVANAANAFLYPDIPGGGTLTLGNNLTFEGLNAGAIFNLNSNNAAGNDEVVLENRALICDGARINIRSTSAGNLSVSDYVLFNVGPTGSILGTFNTKPAWSGPAPENASQYSILTVSNTVVLHYTPIPPPQIGISNGSVVTIKFFGLPTNTYVVLTTTNLTAPWLPLSTNTAGINGSWLFEDSNLDFSPQRFYRSGISN
jgi:autotransporter-associated beta strand protein